MATPTTETTVLPQDEDARIIEDVRRRKKDKKKKRKDKNRAMGITKADKRDKDRANSEQPSGFSIGHHHHDDSLRGRSRSRSPSGRYYRSRSPSPRNYRRSASPPLRATAPLEYRREQRYQAGGPYEPMQHFSSGYNVRLPVGGPISRSPSLSASSSPFSSPSPSPTLPKEKRRSKLLHPLSSTPHTKTVAPKKRPTMGMRMTDLLTRVARIGKNGDNVHFISFGTLQARLIRGKNLPKGGVMTVSFYLPTPSVKKHRFPFGVSRDVRVENYTWDETFTTNVELETRENALDIVRNLVVQLHYTSPHLHRKLGDMEATIDISEMIRSSTSLHANKVKVPLFPLGDKARHKKTVDDKYRPTIYLELLWKPSDAFRHSFATLYDENRAQPYGIKTKVFRLNVGGFAQYGTSYGLIWLQQAAQGWMSSMHDVIDVVNVTSSVQPGPFNMRGRSDMWEAVVTVWYRLYPDRLRAHANQELSVLEGRDQNLGSHGRKHGFRPTGYGQAHPVGHGHISGEFPTSSGSYGPMTGGAYESGQGYNSGSAIAQPTIGDRLAKKHHHHRPVGVGEHHGDLSTYGNQQAPTTSTGPVLVGDRTTEKQY